MQTGRRTLVVVLVVAAIGIPAGILRASCVDNSCRAADDTTSEVPFCSLPPTIRTEVKAGYREGRSPDILMVTQSRDLAGGTALRGTGFDPYWPSISAPGSGSVPIVFSGTGVARRGHIPAGTTLDDIAPTEAGLLHLHRPHPEVRSGTEIPGVATGARPRLLLEVIWKGIGSEALRAHPDAWPTMAKLADQGTETLSGATGSLPLDPAAQVATIGTGGLPSQHGLTGTEVRNDEGDLTRSWGKDAPISVIAALGDDLDHANGQKPLIGVVGTDPTDRGAIGGNWYIGSDRDDMTFVAPGRVREAATTLLGQGYGRDNMPDFLAIVDSGPVERLDSDLSEISRRARKVSGGSVAVVVTGTGTDSARGRIARSTLVTKRVEQEIPGPDKVIQATEPGGLFLDQKVLTKTHTTPNAILQAARSLTVGDRALFHDVFPGIAVSFSRYC